MQITVVERTEFAADIDHLHIRHAGERRFESSLIELRARVQRDQRTPSAARPLVHQRADDGPERSACEIFALHQWLVARRLDIGKERL